METQGLPPHMKMEDRADQISDLYQRSLPLECRSLRLFPVISTEIDVPELDGDEGEPESHSSDGNLDLVRSSDCDKFNDSDRSDHSRVMGPEDRVSMTSRGSNRVHPLDPSPAVSGKSRSEKSHRHVEVVRTKNVAEKNDKYEGTTTVLQRLLTSPRPNFLESRNAVASAWTDTKFSEKAGFQRSLEGLNRVREVYIPAIQNTRVWYFYGLSSFAYTFHGFYLLLFITVFQDGFVGKMNWNLAKTACCRQGSHDDKSYSPGDFYYQETPITAWHTKYLGLVEIIGFLQMSFPSYYADVTHYGCNRFASLVDRLHATFCALWIFVLHSFVYYDSYRFDNLHDILQRLVCSLALVSMIITHAAGHITYVILSELCETICETEVCNVLGDYYSKEIGGKLGLQHLEMLFEMQLEKFNLREEGIQTVGGEVYTATKDQPATNTSLTADLPTISVESRAEMVFNREYRDKSADFVSEVAAVTNSNMSVSSALTKTILNSISAPRIRASAFARDKVAQAASRESDQSTGEESTNGISKFQLSATFNLDDERHMEFSVFLRSRIEEWKLALENIDNKKLIYTVDDHLTGCKPRSVREGKGNKRGNNESNATQKKRLGEFIQRLTVHGEDSDSDVSVNFNPKKTPIYETKVNHSGGIYDSENEKDEDRILGEAGSIAQEWEASCETVPGSGGAGPSSASAKKSKNGLTPHMRLSKKLRLLEISDFLYKYVFFWLRFWREDELEPYFNKLRYKNHNRRRVDLEIRYFKANIMFHSLWHYVGPFLVAINHIMYFHRDSSFIWD